jgi:two-component system invasion response regulator UvrY
MRLENKAWKKRAFCAARGIRKKSTLVGIRRNDSTMPNTRILIVDDHQLIREAWKSILETVPGFEIIGLTDNADDAFAISLEKRPDIVLMDINLRDSNGFEATQRITNSLAKTRIIGLSLHDDVVLVKKLLAKGARGYLSKNVNRSELVLAIGKVLEDEVYIAEEIRAKMMTLDLGGTSPGKKELTNKEIEVVTLIGKGFTSQAIAEKLFVSKRTVETHRHNILKKLSIPNAAQLTSWAREKGYF